MRILFTTASYLPTANGVTYHISSTADALRKLGHKVYILAPSFPGYTDSDKNVTRYPSLPNPFINKYPLGIPFVPIEKIKKINPDIIHTHHPLIVGQFAIQIANKLKKPLFVTAHTQYEQYLNYYFPHGYNITSRIIINDLKNLASHSQKVICPSLNTEQRLNKHGVKNTIVINNGVEPLFFVKPVKKSLVQPTLAYTGRLEKEKNPLHLIKFAKELKKLIPNFRLLIMGSGTMFKEMYNQTLKSKLEENIVFTGEINRMLLPSIYKSVHLFITASLSEVMPISILEAMASGIPTISLRNSGLEELIIDNQSGYICERNPKKIAEKISEIAKNKENYYSLSQKTYEYALSFSAKNTAQKLFDLYTTFKK